MEVVALCPVCSTPGMLTTCALCGLTGHADCLATANHDRGKGDMTQGRLPAESSAKS